MDLIKTILKTTLITAVLMGFTGCTKTVEPTEIMSVNATALDGYDAVAHFVSSKAVKAGTAYVTHYKDLTWNFESQANLDTFSADPEAYIPAFGGFCAYELAEGDFVLSDPEQWYIHNNRLYLFKDEDAKAEWFRAIDSMLLKAQETWKLLTQPVEEEKFEEIGESFMNASLPEEKK
jgi:YHS domain-containing protein